MQTPYCFLTGLVSAMAMDWTGHGLSRRQWRMGSRRDFRRHGIGLLVGFAIMVSLLLTAAILGVTDHTILGVVAALLACACVVAATVIGQRLP
jgi:hypothetical protein